MKNAVNVSKKDIFNAKSGSKSVKEVLGTELTVTGCFVQENEGIRKGTNDPCDIGYISTDAGVVGFSSETCLKAMDAFADYLAEAINDGEEVKIMFKENEGKNGEFYTIEIV